MSIGFKIYLVLEILTIILQGKLSLSMSTYNPLQADLLIQVNLSTETKQI